MATSMETTSLPGNAWRRRPPLVSTTIRANMYQKNPDFRTACQRDGFAGQDTTPSFLTNEIDRVGFLLPTEWTPPQAAFSNVTLEIRQIECADPRRQHGHRRRPRPQRVRRAVRHYLLRDLSPNGNLNPGGWVSLDDGELGDPDGAGWDELGTPTANVLSEGNLNGSRLVANGQSFSLGTAFNTATTLGNRDTNFFFATTDGRIPRRGELQHDVACRSRAGAGLARDCGAGSDLHFRVPTSSRGLRAMNNPAAPLASRRRRQMICDIELTRRSVVSGWLVLFRLVGKSRRRRSGEPPASHAFARNCFTFTFD